MHTVHPTPYILQPTTYTLHPTSYILHPQPSTLNSEPQTLYPEPGTLNPESKLLNPKPQTTNPKSQTPDPHPDIGAEESGEGDGEDVVPGNADSKEFKPHWRWQGFAPALTRCQARKEQHKKKCLKLARAKARIWP